MLPWVKSATEHVPFMSSFWNRNLIAHFSIEPMLTLNVAYRILRGNYLFHFSSNAMLPVFLSAFSNLPAKKFVCVPQNKCCASNHSYIVTTVASCTKPNLGLSHPVSFVSQTLRLSRYYRKECIYSVSIKLNFQIFQATQRVSVSQKQAIKGIELAQIQL